MGRLPIFLTQVSTPEELPATRLLLESLRTFGGEMSGCPFWVFGEAETGAKLADSLAEIFPLSVPEAVKTYPFGEKVWACAQAEALAPAEVHTLVWIDPECLIVQPPLLFDLDVNFDAALRPVHIRNVGLHPAEPLDAFWKGIYAAAGVEKIETTVETFVDGQHLRSYFNSHTFAFNPGLGLGRRWAKLFEQLVNDRNFQATACTDPHHRIFLFQALFSVLVASTVKPERLHLLPPTYNYPYNLHERLPAERRAEALNDLICFTYEERQITPEAVTDIQIREPLRTWLKQRVNECTI